jgi:hypothetical protein
VNHVGRRFGLFAPFGAHRGVDVTPRCVAVRGGRTSVLIGVSTRA